MQQSPFGDDGLLFGGPTGLFPKQPEEIYPTYNVDILVFVNSFH